MFRKRSTKKSARRYFYMVIYLYTTIRVKYRTVHLGLRAGPIDPNLSTHIAFSATPRGPVSLETIGNQCPVFLLGLQHLFLIDDLCSREFGILHPQTNRKNNDFQSNVSLYKYLLLSFLVNDDNNNFEHIRILVEYLGTRSRLSRSWSDWFWRLNRT